MPRAIVTSRSWPVRPSSCFAVTRDCPPSPNRSQETGNFFRSTSRTARRPTSSVHTPFSLVPALMHGIDQRLAGKLRSGPRWIGLCGDGPDVAQVGAACRFFGSRHGTLEPSLCTRKRVSQSPSGARLEVLVLAGYACSLLTLPPAPPRHRKNICAALAQQEHLLMAGRGPDPLQLSGIALGLYQTISERSHHPGVLHVPSGHFSHPGHHPQARWA